MEEGGPGPGQYHTARSNMMLGSELNKLAKAQKKYQKVKNKGAVVKPAPTVPTVPKIERPAEAYTGFGSDTVGPAKYDPQHQMTKPQIAPNFSKSKSKRTVFEPTISIDNKVPDIKNPGPAHYEAHLNKSKSYSYMFNSSVTKELKL